MIATLSSSLMRASRERDGGLYRPLPREGKPRRSAPQPTEARDRPRHDRLVALRLDGGAEELDVVPAVVAGIGERAAEAAEGDVAVADDDPLAGAHGAHLEVAHLDDGDTSRAPPDVRVEPALDPRVVHLEDDAEPGGGEAVREVERLVEGVEEAEIHAELAHRLEREADARPLRLRQEGLDERTGTARRLLPGERARRPGQHEEAARSELGRRPEVRAATLERAALARRVTEREEARRGEARDGEAGLADESRRARHPDRLELPDGHADPGRARGRERLDVPLEGPAEGRDLAHREAHHEGGDTRRRARASRRLARGPPPRLSSPRADRGERPATRRPRTHRPTLAPRRGRAAGGMAGRLRRRGRHLPGDRAAPAGQRLPPPRAAPRARAAPPSRAPREQVTGERAKT